MVVLNKPLEESILVVSEKGYGKRTPIDMENQEAEEGVDHVYRITARGGKGVKTLDITQKTGKLVAIKNVKDENDLMIINKSGITIRLSVQECRLQGRATQGVRLINLEKKNDVIASVCKVLGQASVEQFNRTDNDGETSEQHEN